ncbi:transcriptional regulator, LacI family [Beutenbergia cavernae DSM 12333]|uniref:Transcriptional regulator, LacI family n=1 Tax=Beutenbergia cavernae (strain ATCC BAA-8 / DSM 12333 / CCUG 43141 / JCM 11478 / NBRC 16432 / NCIMB 13614 / HKI 0122) TaxID=471853 RepID=C5C3D5_BEUC1|nr:LacI family DNA-binding transcriptional regulator [Beutenbergia cavernae]ACQ79834.1 transcriptional regulator, LacI family [Beutenbergia cavernae DSM 12333]
MTETDPPASPARPRRVTLRQVAELAGVSTATVSYVLSGRRGGSGVSAETTDRVRAAASQLEYLPNQAARAVRTGRTGVVLLSLHMLADPWSQSVIDAVVPAVRDAGGTALVLADSDWGTALDRVQADVAFIDGVRPEQAPLVRKLARHRSLVVFSETLEPDGFDVVRSEDLPGCRVAMAHLLASHRRIGSLTSVGSGGHRNIRHGVWVQAMRDAGLPHDDSLVAEFRESSSSAFKAATDLLSRPNRPTAVYATTDFAAIAAVEAAQRLRLDVPGDLAVIGVGNASQTELVSPSVSSVGPRDLFPALATLLTRRAAGDDGPGELHEFTWELFARESTTGTTDQ